MEQRRESWGTLGAVRCVDLILSLKGGQGDDMLRGKNEKSGERKQTGVRTRGNL